MTREDFFTRPSDFSFCINPLDINIAKMQEALLARMKTEGPVEGTSFSPIAEMYTSENPLREYGDICIMIYKDENSLTGLYYIADIFVWNKQGDYSINRHLYRGEWEDMMKFVDGKVYTGKENWDFFTLCKANALWLDYQVKNDKEQQRLKALENDLAQEDGNGLNILVCIESGRQENEWPAPQLKQVLPKANIQAPKLPIVGRDASAVVDTIIQNRPDINVVVTGAQVGYFKPDLSLFNVCIVKPQHPLSELGEYVCSEAIAFNIYWRNGADTSLQHRVEKNLRVFAKRILDKRIEQYQHEGGEYEEVANTALVLYTMLLPKLPETGSLENKIEETLPVRVQEKTFQLVMTISPLKEREVSVMVELKHDMIRDHICFYGSGMIDNLGKLLTSRDVMYKIYSSVQSLMASWPTPLEMKLKEAKFIDTDDFVVTTEKESKIVRLNKNCRLHMMGQTFNGIDEVMSWKGEKPTILKRSKLFPCFDSYDYANENRFYHHFLFCKDNADADSKKKDFEAIPRGYGCLIDRRYPEHLRPLVFYTDESDTMLLMY